MAIQKGIVKLTGAIGDIAFAQTKHGYIARENNTISAARIKSDPKFVRTRENGEEFGRSGKAGKVLRKSLRTLVLQASDADLSSRLMAQMMKVLKGDAVNVRGKRTVMDGNLGLLKGFEFNLKAPLEHTFVAPYTVSINRASGETSINIAAFSPKQFIVAPPGATHCRIVTAGVMVDFDGEVHVGSTSRSQDIDLTAVQQAAINHLNVVTANGTAPIFVAIGAQFYEKVNNVLYPLLDLSYNTLSIIAVDGGARAAQLKLDSAASLIEEPAAFDNQPL